MIPLVMEHFGRWGEEGRKYLQKLAQKSTNEVGLPNAAVLGFLVEVLLCTPAKM